MTGFIAWFSWGRPSELSRRTDQGLWIENVYSYQAPEVIFEVSILGYKRKADKYILLLYFDILARREADSGRRHKFLGLIFSSSSISSHLAS
jgi:hypothetical protein